MNNQYFKIKKIHQANIDKILDEYKVFWAFSKEQLEQGKMKTRISEDKDLVSIGMGGFCPRKNADKLFAQLDKEENRYNKELKKEKDAKEQAILYELNNHECFYTQNFSAVVEIFKSLYSKKDIATVFNKRSR